MDTPRFLVAKYLPDVFRNEPKNIGIVFWSPEITLARFIGERPESPGTVDEREIPSFVASPAAYTQWVRYWQREIAKPVIRPATGGPPVQRSSPGYLDALRQTGPGNYLLYDGGTFDNPIPISEIAAVLDELFAEYAGPGRSTFATVPQTSAEHNPPDSQGPALAGPAANSVQSQGRSAPGDFLPEVPLPQRTVSRVPVVAEGPPEPHSIVAGWASRGLLGNKEMPQESPAISAVKYVSGMNDCFGYSLGPSTGSLWS